MKFIFVVFFAIYINNGRCFYSEKGIQKFDVFMPNVRPQRENAYLCTPVKINQQTSYYVVAFEPKATMGTVHHMILYGCSAPGKSESVWDCGEMSSLDDDGVRSSPCKNGSTILYAWARDAPKLELPDDVAFKVGKDSEIEYLVLQVHYNHVDYFKNERNVDASGLTLKYTETPQPKLAGVLLLGTGGGIAKFSTASMETACPIEEDKEIHPFGFRIHTHELGVRVAGYRIRKLNNIQYWTKIGEHDPLEPQMFYPVHNKIILKKGDYVAASCKMDATNRDRQTVVGATGEDEMCNFYMMYWVEDTTPLKQHFCFSPGPPYYYWSQSFENIPYEETLDYRRYRNDTNM